jgi:predicted Zn-dependent protease
MPLPTHLILRAAACLSALFVLTGCNTSDDRARDALSAYQAAAASNDLIGARRALLELVRAKDDVPDYWIELGKLQASTGNFSDAYYALTRAYELDRSNADILRAVVQLALRSGDVVSAQNRANELEIVSPGDPWVKLTRGWAAFSQSRFDQALAAGDSILASSPFDPAGTVLKARALMSLNRQDEATELLTKQMQAQPTDAASLQLLAKIYVQRNDWPRVVQLASRLSKLRTDDTDSRLLLIQAALHSGNIGVARQTSAQLLKPNAVPLLINAVLDLWEDYWPSQQRISDARTLAASTPGLEQKLVYAAFLNRNGSPADAIRLSAVAAGLPINAANAEANAVLADGWSRSGNVAPAKARFDAILAFDPGNATALRGRAELEIRTGNSGAAIADAQKLVSVLPNSSRDRLLLARAYAAAGNSAWAERTLWTAFQEIPADEKIYAALQATEKGNAGAIRDLQGEFNRQRDSKLNRGLL